MGKFRKGLEAKVSGPFSFFWEVLRKGDCSRPAVAAPTPVGVETRRRVDFFTSFPV